MKITQIKIFNGTDWIDYTLSVEQQLEPIYQELLRLDAADTANINFISSEISGINSEISGINQELPTKLSKPQIAVEKKQLVAINTNNEQEFVSEDNYMKYNDLLQYLSGIIKVQSGDMPLGTKFQNLSESHSIVISDGVTEIPNEAFKGCGKVNNIFFADSILKVGQNAFNDTAFYKDNSNWEDNQRILYINKVLVRAKEYHFQNQTLTVKDGTVVIAGSSLRSTNSSVVVLPNTLKTIGDAAFYYTTCREITIPDSVTYLGASVFAGSSVLKKVVMGQGITAINSGTFHYCTVLEVVDFRQATQIPTLANTNIFSGASTTYRIVVPNNLYDEWIVATNWSAFASKIVKASEYTEA